MKKLIKRMSTFQKLSLANGLVMIVTLLSHDWFFIAFAAINTLDTLAWAIWESKK
jgi:hypothetical protein